jgi:undecaprenyl-diphosphatase
MTIIGAIILALAAGITEVFPVSGTGHFYILDRVIGVSLNQAERQSLQGVIYLGTALALLLFYRREAGEMLRALAVLLGVRRPGRQDRNNTFSLRQLLLLSISSLPMLAGLVLLPTVRKLEAGEFGLLWISAALVFSGLLFYFSMRSARQKRSLRDMTLGNCLLIGLSQLPTVFPGLSRAGFTMSVALMLGYDGTSAFTCSGLMGIPVFLAAGLLNVLQADSLGVVSTPALLSLAVLFLSAVTGILALYWFSAKIRETRLTGFAFWCWGASIVSLVLFLISA